MKLKRAWPAIFIWVVFVLFDILMVASSSFFSGLFPSENLLVYVGVFTGLSILAMSILTFALGKLSDSLMAHDFRENKAFRIFYSILVTLIIVGGVWYRLEIMADCPGDITGKYSLYENAMVGGTNITPENDLLSIAYSSILKLILFFTGNIISVPFFFQIACFTIFMICCFFTVKRLLGMAAAVVFTAYVAFMPVFTNAFTGLELSTDSLFMAMFGFELLIVGQYLKGAYKGLYRSNLWIIGYALVGAAVGFMTYVDAGTFIMILPFLLASLFLYGRKAGKEALRLLCVLLAAVLTFFGMIVQEVGFAAIPTHLEKWATNYFHNLNTFSVFWAYTDHKLIYLITVIAMSGVIVGFWKNRKVEKISPWLLSLLLMFATVPFMGPTRMNTQVFVTVYYAFILGCVASLITLPANEAGDYDADTDQHWVNGESAEALETAAGVSTIVQPEYEFEDDGEDTEAAAEDSEIAETAEAAEAATEAAPENKIAEDAISEESADDATQTSSTTEAALADAVTQTDSEAVDGAVASDTEPKTEKLFIPEGMVLPVDDKDVDLTPRMKMPVPPINLGADGRPEKLHINRREPEFEYIPDEKDTVVTTSSIVAATLAGIADVTSGISKYIDEYSTIPASAPKPDQTLTSAPKFAQAETSDSKPAPSAASEPKTINAPAPVRSGDDFDLALRPGDDFDI